MTIITRPAIEYKKSFIKAVREMQAVNNLNGSNDWYKRKLKIDELESDFPSYLATIAEREKGIELNDGQVPLTMFWIINDQNEYVGRISLRHYLTPHLEQNGGHIGYDVIPSQQRKGYATKALALCLKEATKMGMKSVIMACAEDNDGSRKTIEKNGGELLNRYYCEEEKSWSLRYSIKVGEEA